MMRKEKNIIWLPDIINKITLFTFMLSILILLTFLAGNKQGFIDSTQTLLLRVFRTTAIVFIVTGVYNVIISFAVLIRSRRLYSFRLIMTILGEGVMITSFLGTSGILAIIKG